MRSWVVGWNEPGCLPTDTPAPCQSWSEARSVLRAEMGEHFVVKVDTERTPDHEVMFAYTQASATIRCVKEGHPFSLFYDGLVWWVADLPTSVTEEMP